MANLITYHPAKSHFIHRSRRNRAYRWDYNTRGDNADHQNDDHDDMNDDDNGQTKAMDQPKADYWAGYYDFLINEGSYKFWAVFQVILNLNHLICFPSIT